MPLHDTAQTNVVINKHFVVKYQCLGFNCQYQTLADPAAQAEGTPLLCHSPPSPPLSLLASPYLTLSPARGSVRAL